MMRIKKFYNCIQINVTLYAIVWFTIRIYIYIVYYEYCYFQVFAYNPIAPSDFADNSFFHLKKLGGRVIRDRKQYLFLYPSVRYYNTFEELTYSLLYILFYSIYSNFPFRFHVYTIFYTHHRYKNNNFGFSD